MGSSSSSSSATTNQTRDGRVAGDNGAIGISADGGDVTLHMVSDEAWQLGREALEELGDLARLVTTTGGRATETAQGALALALETTQEKNRTEATQLSEQVIKIGIPAAAIAFAVSQIWRK